VADARQRMVFLGFGKYARADRIYALEPLRGDERGGGRRTRVWVDGIPDPVVASRTVTVDSESTVAVNRPHSDRAGVRPSGDFVSPRGSRAAVPVRMS